MSAAGKLVPKNLKRKRKQAALADLDPLKPKKVKRHIGSGCSQDEINGIEDSILESRKNYNNILDLLSLTKKGNPSAAVASCRVFCRLIAINELGSKHAKSGNDFTISEWLQDKLTKFESLLLKMLQSTNSVQQSTALSLWMQLTKQKAEFSTSTNDLVLTGGNFTPLLQILTSNSGLDTARTMFINEFLSRYYDIQRVIFKYFR